MPVFFQVREKLLHTDVPRDDQDRIVRPDPRLMVLGNVITRDTLHRGFKSRAGEGGCVCVILPKEEEGKNTKSHRCGLGFLSLDPCERLLTEPLEFFLWE